MYLLFFKVFAPKRLLRKVCRLALVHVQIIVSESMHFRKMHLISSFCFGLCSGKLQDGRVEYKPPVPLTFVVNQWNYYSAKTSTYQSSGATGREMVRAKRNKRTKSRPPIGDLLFFVFGGQNDNFYSNSFFKSASSKNTAA